MTLSGETVSDFELHRGLAEFLTFYRLETVDPAQLRYAAESPGPYSTATVFPPIGFHRTSDDACGACITGHRRSTPTEPTAD